MPEAEAVYHLSESSFVEVITEASEVAAVPVRSLWGDMLSAESTLIQALATTAKFSGKAGEVLIVPGEEGTPIQVLFGLGDEPQPMAFRSLAQQLPTGVYRIAQVPEGMLLSDIALAFSLGSYRFDRYKAGRSAARPTLAVEDIDIAEVRQIAKACALARDMVNTPANDMGPAQIEAIARDVAEQHGAEIAVISGDDLLRANYPAIHAVGRAAVPERAPRMVEITWGEANKPLVALVGKGVVFDTGGLDIKAPSGMRWMKKDMGGAAHVLALGQMIMTAKLPVGLAILIPVVENAIAGDAMRPGDILASRKGLTIEVGNTDAEGRLILADALTRAAELEPALTIDIATLTGAARVALGPQLPPFFTDDEQLAAQIYEAAHSAHDPVWRLPLWKGYVGALDSDLADIKNDPDGWAQAGAVTAGLFLQRFAPDSPWAHVDLMAWNPRGVPGAPIGAEAQAIRGLYKMIKARFS